MVNNYRIFSPSTYQELFNIWKNNPMAILYAGGTELIRSGKISLPGIHEDLISLEGIEEMHRISRTERYLELGAMVKLNRIIKLGKIVPEALIKCLENISSPQIRNIGTIGGNICNPDRRLDSSVPLIALDAQLELRNSQYSRWVSASQFASMPGQTCLEKQELVSRIRIPLEPWTYTLYKKHSNYGEGPGGGILFIMKNQKNILSAIRIVYAGKIILREKNSETMLTGKKLPLETREKAAFIENWNEYLSLFKDNDESILAFSQKNANTDLVKNQIMNFIETALTGISN